MKVATHILAVALGFFLCGYVRSCMTPDPPATTGIIRSDKKISDELTQPATPTRPDRITIYAGGREDSLQHEIARLRVETARILAGVETPTVGPHSAAPVRPRGAGAQAESISAACRQTAPNGGRGTSALSPLLLNADVSLALALFAREQQRSHNLDPDFRFVLLPYSMGADRPVITVDPGVTSLDVWDPLFIGWQGYEYRHAGPRLFYIGAAAALFEDRTAWGPTLSIDHHVGRRFRTGGRLFVDIAEPSHSWLLASLEVGV